MGGGPTSGGGGGMGMPRQQGGPAQMYPTGQMQDPRLMDPNRRGPVQQGYGQQGYGQAVPPSQFQAAPGAIRGPGGGEMPPQQLQAGGAVQPGARATMRSSGAQTIPGRGAIRGPGAQSVGGANPPRDYGREGGGSPQDQEAVMPPQEPRPGRPTAGGRTPGVMPPQEPQIDQLRRELSRTVRDPTMTQERQNAEAIAKYGPDVFTAERGVSQQPYNTNPDPRAQVGNAQNAGGFNRQQFMTPYQTQQGGMQQGGGRLADMLMYGNQNPGLTREMSSLVNPSRGPVTQMPNGLEQNMQQSMQQGGAMNRQRLQPQQPTWDGTGGKTGNPAWEAAQRANQEAARNAPLLRGELQGSMGYGQRLQPQQSPGMAK